MMDRFHLFIPGWQIPKISEGQLYYGWAIDAEVFSEYLHYMRTETYSQKIFDELVEYDKKTAYVRHAKAVRKIAKAYCKLLFPHVKSLDELSPEDLTAFKTLYREYCLLPAIEARSYIYNQCRLVDSEYRYNTMPEFEIPEVRVEIHTNGINEVPIDAFDENNDLAEDSQIVSEIEVLDESGDIGTIRSQED